MKTKTKRIWAKVGLVITAVGGLVHLFQPLGWNILNLFGTLKGLIQFVAGAVTIIIVITGWKMMKKK